MEWCKVLVWAIITHTECQGTLMMTCNPQLQEVMQHSCHQNFLQSISWHLDPFKNSRRPVITLRTQKTWDTVYNVNKNRIQQYFKSHNLIYFSQYNLQTHLMLKIRKHTILRKNICSLWVYGDIWFKKNCMYKFWNNFRIVLLSVTLQRLRISHHPQHITSSKESENLCARDKAENQYWMPMIFRPSGIKKAGFCHGNRCTDSWTLPKKSLSVNTGLSSNAG